MREQAQTAKFRRACISLIARFGAIGLLKYFTLSEAEKAAIAMRKIKRTASPNPTTTFAIPLVGSHQVSEWAVIEETLSKTLTALIAQSNPNWRVVICSQNRPDATSLDPRVQHIEFNTKVDGHDKIAKLAVLTKYCLQDHARAGFFMPLDGDDLLHRDYVAKLHSDPKNGFLICGGFIVDYKNARIGQTQNKSLRSPFQKPFWKFCGSCMALPVGMDQERETAFFQGLANHEHRLYPYLAKLAGFSLVKLIQPSALYFINHGENFETRRGRGGFKQRFVQQFEVTDPATLSKASEDFPGLHMILTPRKADL
jgi:hypothetical protein